MPASLDSNLQLLGVQSMASRPLGLLDLGARTVDFYKAEIAHQYHNVNGSNPSFLFTVIPTDFSVINAHLPNQFEVLKPLIARQIEHCIDRGITTLIIPNVTLHETVDQLAPSLLKRVHIIHPVLACIQRLQSKKANAITLIASQYSVTSSRLARYFEQSNIAIHRPTAQHIARIDEIRRRTYVGEHTQEDIQYYRDLIARYQQRAPVVVACTELSLLLNGANCHDVFDMARIQITEALLALSRDRAVLKG